MGVTLNPDGGGAASGRSSQVIQEDDALYYIYASSSGKAPGENINVLAEGSPTDTFVSTLNDDQAIVLSSTPNPTASLDSTDETLKWFQQLDSTVTGSVTVDQTKGVQSFSLELQTPWKLTFSSTAEVLLYTFGPPSVGAENRIPPPGIEVDGQMLTLGLDFQQTVDVSSSNTLRDLFENAGAAGMVDYVPSELLDLAVTLNAAEGDQDPKRNAIWYVPASSKCIVMRLQFQVPQFDLLQEVLGTTLTGFTLKSAQVIFNKDIILAETDSGSQPLFQGSVAFSVECSVRGGNSDEVLATAAIDLSESSISLTFLFKSENDPLSGILKWLASLIGDDTLESLVYDILGKKESGTDVFSHYILRRIIVSLDTLDPANRKLSSFAFDIEVSTNIGGGPDSRPAVFLLSYNWDRLTGGFGQLAGQLWTSVGLPQDLDLLPHEEKWTILQPVTTTPATSIKIASLIPGQTVDNIPDTLPSEISAAYISLTQDSFAIRCSVTSNHPPASSVPQPYLGEVTLEGSFNWGKSSSFGLSVFISAGIEPSEEDASNDIEPAVLQGALTYDSSNKEWKLGATLTGLYAATLVEFFKEGEEKPHVGPLINSIAINTLDVQYTYTGASGSGTSTGSSFLIQGDLLIAGLKLGLIFTYDKDGSFNFNATLNPENTSATIGDVLASILGSADIELPDFVYNTQIGSEGGDVFNLEVTKKESSFLFISQFGFANVRIDFAQMHGIDWDAKTPSKRLVRVGIALPTEPEQIDLPLIGTITQPLDELCFLWVQDPAPAAPGKITGLTRSDTNALDSGLHDPLLLKDKIKPESQTPGDLLMAAGCHFAVIVHSSTGVRSCLLDYEFMKPSPSPNSNSSKELKSKQGAAREEPGDDGSPSAQAPFKKAAGPLSISNVSLKYKDKQLAIMFDATFQLGPLGFSLVGFSLGFSFTALGDAPKITPAILGLAASFEQLPLSIAGVIRHGNDGGTDYYAGGLVVGWQPYQFEAAGFYGDVTPSGSSTPFRSVFIFAKLNGPLVTLEFAEIDSLCGGFGYNSTIRLPTVDEVYEFPFIANTDLSGKDNAMEALTSLVDPSGGGWFKPLDKMYWLAVGMGVGAFQMLNIDAVVAVQFGSAIKLGIFAVATADIPTAASSFKLAHVELGISAIADFDYGTLKIDAQLSPRSYILDPNCHLTGGFSLYYWFDAPHADSSIVGQYVFTLGGYHQAFKKPIGFPNPPRLGISWDLGGGLTVSGEAYFAITPKCCMAGGRLHAALSAGPLSAWFDAFADFLINYKPFYFNMDAGLSVGVKFSLDIWFIHIRISVEIGAQLYLWGPPIAGRVHVNFWIVAFDINFGKDEPRDEAISLLDFYLLVLQSQTSASKLSAAAKSRLGIASQDDDGDVVEAQDEISRPMNEGHNFLAQSGLLNPADNPERNQNDEWIVRAGSFSFVVECKMAIDAVKNDPEAEEPILTYDGVYSRPMKLKIGMSMSSTLTVVVQQDGESEPDEGWQYSRYLKSLPQALWGQYTCSTDPRKMGNNISDILNTGPGAVTPMAVTLMAGVQITAPKPTIAPDPFPAYEVADADLQRLLSERSFPDIVEADGAWAPDQRDADENVQDEYDTVLDKWSNPTIGTGDEGRRGFVGVLAKTFQWGLADEMKSIADLPVRLMNGFKDLYVAAPLLTK